MGKITLTDSKVIGCTYLPEQEIRFFLSYPLGIFSFISTISTFLQRSGPISLMGSFTGYFLDGRIADMVFEDYSFGSALEKRNSIYSKSIITFWSSNYSQTVSFILS